MKFAAIVLIFSFLVAAAHRRCCSSSRRAAKKVRREERHRRRAFRRAARKHAWKSWFANLMSSKNLDYEEKRAMLAEQALLDVEESGDDTVGSEIHQLRNAAGVVEQIVAAEEGRARLSIGSLPDYRSELGEELPTYTPSDGTEASSIVVDGFRYTPGTTEYTPSTGTSEEGSVRNVLGDTKD